MTKAARAMSRPVRRMGSPWSCDRNPRQAAALGTIGTSHRWRHDADDAAANVRSERLKRAERMLGESPVRFPSRQRWIRQGRNTALDMWPTRVVGNSGDAAVRDGGWDGPRPGYHQPRRPIPPQPFPSGDRRRRPTRRSICSSTRTRAMPRHSTRSLGAACRLFDGGRAGGSPVCAGPRRHPGSRSGRRRPHADEAVGFEHRHQGALQAYLRQAVINRIRDQVRRHARRPVAVELKMSMRTPGRLSPRTSDWQRGCGALRGGAGAPGGIVIERRLSREWNCSRVMRRWH